MRIRKIRAKNYGSYPDLEIDFEKLNSITFITAINLDEGGDKAGNGSGKSTIPDCLSWGLYGKSIEDRAIKELVNWHGDGTMFVETWVDDLHLMRKVQSGKSKLKVWKIDPDTLVENDITTTASQEWLDSYWSCSWQTFQLIYRFSGGETGAISYVTAGADYQRKVQDNLVQADRITSCLGAARSIRNLSLKQLESASTLAERERAEIDRDEEQAVEARYAIEQEKLRRQDDLCDAQKAVDDLQPFDQAKEQKKFDEYTKLVSQRDTATHSFDESKSQLDAIMERCRDMLRDAENYEQGVTTIITSEQPSTADLDEARETVAALKAKRQSINAGRSSLADVDTELYMCRQRLAKHEQELNGIKTELANASGIVDPSEMLEDAKVALENAKQAKAKASDKCNAARKRLQAVSDPSSDIVILRDRSKFLNEQLGSIDDEISKIESEIDGLKNLKPGSKCPTCKSPVNKDNVGGAIADAKSRLDATLLRKKSLENHIDENNERLSEAKERIEKSKVIEDELASLVAREKKLDEYVLKASDDVSSAKEEVIRYEKLAASLGFKRKNRDNLESLIDGIGRQIERLEAERQSKMGSGLAEVEAELAGAEKKLLDLQTQMDEWERERASNESIRTSRLAKAAGLREMIAQRKKDASKLHKKILELQEEMKSLSGQIDALGTVMTEREISAHVAYIEKVHDALDAAKKKLSEPYAGQSSLDACMKRLTERKKKLGEFQSEIDKQQDIRPYLEWWAEAFDSGGVRSFVMKELVTTLNREASRYLSHLLGSRVGIRFLDGLEPSLYRIDSGTPVSYAQCSGGQKRRVKIASALAFLDVMRSAAGCDLDVFVLDEIENSLDEAGLLGMRDALREVSSERKVIVITQSRFFAESLAENGAGKICVEYKDARSKIA